MERNQTDNTAMMWVIGIISIVALVLAWAAYNRAGENLTAQIERETGELAAETGQAVDQLGGEIESAAGSAMTATQNSAARVQARAELLAMQAELEAEENYAAAAQRVQDLRADLDRTYANTTGAAQMQWQELDAELEQLEQSVRTESADALEMFGGLVLMLEEDVRTDEE